MLARRFVPFAVAIALAATAPAASASTKKVSAPAPSDGKAALVQFEVRGKGKKPLRGVKISVDAPGAAGELGVVVHTVTLGKRIGVTAVIFNPKTDSARASGEPGGVNIVLESGREISVADVQRVADVVSGLTVDQRRKICVKKRKKGRERLRQALGTFVDGQQATAKLLTAIRRLLCGKFRDKDRAFLESIGIVVEPEDDAGGDQVPPPDDGGGEPTPPPGDDTEPPPVDEGPNFQGTYDCDPFAGNPNEGSCRYDDGNGTTFNAVRVTATDGMTFTQAYHDESPAVTWTITPGSNNSITYVFPDQRTSTGTLYMRADRAYTSWPGVVVEVSQDGGATWHPLGTF